MLTVFGAVAELERGKLPVSDIMAQTGLKEATFYRRLREQQNSEMNSSFLTRVNWRCGRFSATGKSAGSTVTD